MKVDSPRVRPDLQRDGRLPAYQQDASGGLVACHTMTLCGIGFVAEFNDPVVRERVLSLWDRLFAFSPVAVDFSRSANPIRMRIIKVSQGAPRPAHDPHFVSPMLNVWRTDTGFHLFSDDSSIEVDTISGNATVNIVDAFWSSPLPVQRELFLISVLMLMQRKRVHGLHAVALVNSGVGLLVVGDSGAGKTTTGLALIRNGWSYLSDDAVGLSVLSGGREVGAVAFRRGFSCTRESWDALSTNTAADRDGYQLARDKWLIDISEFAPGKQAYSCVPRVVAFPVVTKHKTSSVTMLDDTEGLLRLLPQSAGITVDRDIAREQMKMLGLLADQVQFCVINAGRDVFSDPDHISKLFMNAARRAR